MLESNQSACQGSVKKKRSEKVAFATFLFFLENRSDKFQGFGDRVTKVLLLRSYIIHFSRYNPNPNISIYFS